MTAELLCIGEPMLEFNQQPPLPDGRVIYVQGFGGDSSNVAVAAARQGAQVGYITAIGRGIRPARRCSLSGPPRGWT